MNKEKIKKLVQDLFKSTKEVKELEALLEEVETLQKDRLQKIKRINDKMGAN